MKSLQQCAFEISEHLKKAKRISRCFIYFFYTFLSSLILRFPFSFNLWYNKKMRGGNILCLRLTNLFFFPIIGCYAKVKRRGCNGKINSSSISSMKSIHTKSANHKRENYTSFFIFNQKVLIVFNLTTTNIYFNLYSLLTRREFVS